MSNTPALNKTSAITKPVADFLSQDNVKQKFKEILGKKAIGFVASVLAAVNSSDLLRNAEPATVYSASMIAATLDLPINPNLGFAFLIPYKTKQSDGSYKVVCQFQIAAKGFKQLAQRSGQYLRITDAIVYEGQLIEENPLTGYLFDWTKKKSENIIGFVSYFKLINGFESTLYMTKEQTAKHGAKYSKTFKGGKWETDFEAMSLKTVTKLNLSKNGPMSIEMQTATLSDQSIIKENGDYEYVDNTQDAIVVSTLSDEVRHEWTEIANNCTTVEDVDHAIKSNKVSDKDILNILQERKTQLSNEKV